MFDKPGLMVLGTDTEVGKTFVACRILESLVRDGVAAGAYKPVASGASSLEQSDAYQLWIASGRRGTLSMVNPQSFRAAVAPPVAAELEQNQVDESLLLDGLRVWQSNCDFLVAEGAGGLMSPISWNMTNADFARASGLPVLLVSRNRLGVVNQVLTTLAAARSLGLEVRCIVINHDRAESESDPSRVSNISLLSKYLNRQSTLPLLTEIQYSAREFSPDVEWPIVGNRDDS